MYTVPHPLRSVRVGDPGLEVGRIKSSERYLQRGKPPVIFVVVVVYVCFSVLSSLFDVKVLFRRRETKKKKTTVKVGTSHFEVC